MNKELLFLMLLSIAFVLPLVAWIVDFIDRKDKRKLNTGAAMYLKRNRRSSLYHSYVFLNSFLLTKSYFRKVRNRYEILYPGDAKLIADKTMQVFLTSFLICTIEITLIFFMKPNFHNGVLAAILVYVLNNEIVNRLANNTEIMLLEQMSVFVSEVRHNYHSSRMVDEAILSSLQELKYEMKIHAFKLYDIITSDCLKEEVIRYNATTSNKYLKMFLSLSMSVMEYKDKKINGQFLFATNLEHLKREIHIEIIKLKKLRYVFSGTIFVAIAVCIPVDAIQGFGIYLVPELEGFYTGQGGILFVSAIFLSSILVYLLVNHLKEIKPITPPSYRYLQRLEKLRFIKHALDNYSEKNYGRMVLIKDLLRRVGDTISPRQLLLKRIVVAFGTLLICIALVCFGLYSNKVNLLNKTSGLENMKNLAGRNQQAAVDMILQYVNLYEEAPLTEEQYQRRIEDENPFINNKASAAMAEEIHRRISKSHEVYFHWYEWIACLLAAMGAYYVPYWLLLYKKRILRMSMEDEVNQFHSILFMLMYIDHMTVKTLLEQMELFALVFKQSIRECINDFNCGEMEALTRMKENENFGPFKRLVDNLIRCDILPIDKAFDEIVSDRENYYDHRKLENEISIQKRADTAKPLSFIPAVLVTIYLLLPLLIASLKELESFRENLQALGF